MNYYCPICGKKDVFAKSKGGGFSVEEDECEKHDNFARLSFLVERVKEEKDYMMDCFFDRIDELSEKLAK